MQREYQKIYQALKKRLLANEWAEGDTMPSEKQLCAEFSVCRNTVRKALQLLINEKLIVRYPGIGTVAAAAPASIETPVVALVQRESCSLCESFYSDYVIQGIQDVVAQMNGEFLLLERSLLNPAVIHRANGVILLSPERDLMEKMHSLLRPDQHVVVINRDIALPEFSCLTADYTEDSCQIVRYALQQGFQRVAIIGSNPGFSGYALRTVGYRKAFRAEDLPVEQDLILPYSDAVQPERLREFLIQTQPDAIFVAAGELMNSLMITGIQLNRNFFEDTFVMCYDDFNDQEAWRNIPFMYIQMPLRQMAQAATRIILDPPQDQPVHQAFQSRFVFNAGSLRIKNKRRQSHPKVSNEMFVNPVMTRNQKQQEKQ